MLLLPCFFSLQLADKKFVCGMKISEKKNKRPKLPFKRCPLSSMYGNGKEWNVCRKTNKHILLFAPAKCKSQWSNDQSTVLMRTLLTRHIGLYRRWQAINWILSHRHSYSCSFCENSIGTFTLKFCCFRDDDHKSLGSRIGCMLFSRITATHSTSTKQKNFLFCCGHYSIASNNEVKDTTSYVNNVCEHHHFCVVILHVSTRCQINNFVNRLWQLTLNGPESNDKSNRNKVKTQHALHDSKLARKLLKTVSK